MSPREQLRLRHTFLGVGLMPVDSGETHAFLAIISNAADGMLTPTDLCGVDYRFKWRDLPFDTFTARVIDVQSLRDPVLLPIGADCRAADDLLKAAHRAARNGRSEDEIRSMLERTIKKVAASDKQGPVGPDVTTICSKGVITSRGAGLMTGSITKGALIVLGELIFDQSFIEQPFSGLAPGNAKNF